MARPAPRSEPLGPNPHGPTVEWECRVCGARTAAYEGLLPRDGWTGAPGRNPPQGLCGGCAGKAGGEGEESRGDEDG